MTPNTPKITSEQIVAATGLSGLDEVIEVLEKASGIYEDTPLISRFAGKLLFKINQIHKAEVTPEDLEDDAFGDEDEDDLSFGRMVYNLGSLDPEENIDIDAELKKLIEFDEYSIKEDLIEQIQKDYRLDLPTYDALAGVTCCGLTEKTLLKGVEDEKQEPIYTLEEQLDILSNIYSKTADKDENGRSLMNSTVTERVAETLGFTLEQIHTLSELKDAADEARVLQTVGNLAKLFGLKQATGKLHWFYREELNAYTIVPRIAENPSAFLSKVLKMGLPKELGLGKPPSCGTIPNVPPKAATP